MGLRKERSPRAVAAAAQQTLRPLAPVGSPACDKPLKVCLSQPKTLFSRSHEPKRLFRPEVRDCVAVEAVRSNSDLRVCTTLETGTYSEQRAVWRTFCGSTAL